MHSKEASQISDNDMSDLNPQDILVLKLTGVSAGYFRKLT